MNHPVVVITGALTGIGRATASPAAVNRKARRWKSNYRHWVPKRFSCSPMCGTRKKSGV